MATFEWQGFDDYMKELDRLAKSTTGMVKRAVYQGAAVVANEVRAHIEALPVTDRNPKKGDKLGVLEYERDGLLEGLGLSGMKDDNGFIYTAVGFDGYNRLTSEKYPNGHPNAMVARSIESGSSMRKKHPFMRPALKAARDRAVEAMRVQMDMDIQSIVKE